MMTEPRPEPDPIHFLNLVDADRLNKLIPYDEIDLRLNPPPSDPRSTPVLDVPDNKPKTRIPKYKPVRPPSSKHKQTVHSQEKKNSPKQSSKRTQSTSQRSSSIPPPSTEQKTTQNTESSKSRPKSVSPSRTKKRPTSAIPSKNQPETLETIPKKQIPLPKEAKGNVKYTKEKMRKEEELKEEEERKKKEAEEEKRSRWQLPAHETEKRTKERYDAAMARQQYERYGKKMEEEEKRKAKVTDFMKELEKHREAISSRGTRKREQREQKEREEKERVERNIAKHRQNEEMKNALRKQKMHELFERRKEEEQRRQSELEARNRSEERRNKQKRYANRKQWFERDDLEYELTRPTRRGRTGSGKEDSQLPESDDDNYYNGRRSDTPHTAQNNKMQKVDEKADVDEHPQEPPSLRGSHNSEAPMPLQEQASRHTQEDDDVVLSQSSRSFTVNYSSSPTIKRGNGRILDEVANGSQVLNRREKISTYGSSTEEEEEDDGENKKRRRKPNQSPTSTPPSTERDRFQPDTSTPPSTERDRFQPDPCDSPRRSETSRHGSERKQADDDPSEESDARQEYRRPQPTQFSPNRHWKEPSPDPEVNPPIHAQKPDSIETLPSEGNMSSLANAEPSIRPHSSPSSGVNPSPTTNDVLSFEAERPVEQQYHPHVIPQQPYPPPVYNYAQPLVTPFFPQTYTTLPPHAYPPAPSLHTQPHSQSSGPTKRFVVRIAASDSDSDGSVSDNNYDADRRTLQMSRTSLDDSLSLTHSPKSRKGRSESWSTTKPAPDLSDTGRSLSPSAKKKQSTSPKSSPKSSPKRGRSKRSRSRSHPRHTNKEASPPKEDPKPNDDASKLESVLQSFTELVKDMKNELKQPLPEDDPPAPANRRANYASPRTEPELEHERMFLVEDRIHRQVEKEMKLMFEKEQVSREREKLKQDQDQLRTEEQRLLEWKKAEEERLRIEAEEFLKREVERQRMALHHSPEVLIEEALPPKQHSPRESSNEPLLISKLKNGPTSKKRHKSQSQSPKRLNKYASPKQEDDSSDQIVDCMEEVKVQEAVEVSTDPANITKPTIVVSPIQFPIPVLSSETIVLQPQPDGSSVVKELPLSQKSETPPPVVSVDQVSNRNSVDGMYKRLVDRKRRLQIEEDERRRQEEESRRAAEERLKPLTRRVDLDETALLQDFVRNREQHLKDEARKAEERKQQEEEERRRRQQQKLEDERTRRMQPTPQISVNESNTTPNLPTAGHSPFISSFSGTDPGVDEQPRVARTLPPSRFMPRGTYLMDVDDLASIPTSLLKDKLSEAPSADRMTLPTTAPLRENVTMDLRNPITSQNWRIATEQPDVSPASQLSYHPSGIPSSGVLLTSVLTGRGNPSPEDWKVSRVSRQEEGEQRVRNTFNDDEGIFETIPANPRVRPVASHALSKQPNILPNVAAHQLQALLRRDPQIRLLKQEQDRIENEFLAFLLPAEQERYQTMLAETGFHNLAVRLAEDDGDEEDEEVLQHLAETPLFEEMLFDFRKQYASTVAKEKLWIEAERKVKRDIAAKREETNDLIRQAMSIKPRLPKSKMSRDEPGMHAVHARFDGSVDENHASNKKLSMSSSFGHTLKSTGYYKDDEFDVSEEEEEFEKDSPHSAHERPQTRRTDSTASSPRRNIQSLDSTDSSFDPPPREDTVRDSSDHNSTVGTPDSSPVQRNIADWSDSDVGSEKSDQHDSLDDASRRAQRGPIGRYHSDRTRHSSDEDSGNQTKRTSYGQISGRSFENHYSANQSPDDSVRMSGAMYQNVKYDLDSDSDFEE